MLSFFGQFMVDQGIIDRAQLRTALELTAKTNLPIGELAIEAGFISKEDAGIIHSEQRSHDLYFGEVAVQRCLMTELQVDQLLEKQKKNHIRVGEALIRLGYSKKNQIEQAYFKYCNSQAEHQLTPELPTWIIEDRLFMYVIDYLPKLILRMAAMTMKIGRGAVWMPGRTFDLTASVVSDGDATITIALDISKQLGHGIAKGMFGMEGDEPDEDTIVDSTVELLIILARTTRNYVEKRGETVLFEYPQHSVLPGEGYSFPMVTPDGRGVLVLSKLL
ncbi:MAG: hypothetical protein GY847_15340 [Proteobacteria bacterium]|nr:hypothetical protein [Pseudomonadota bacterium]